MHLLMACELVCSTATCNIPAKYAYGAKGVCIEGEKGGCLIPPNEDLKYAVKLLSVGAGYN